MIEPNIWEAAAELPPRADSLRVQVVVDDPDLGVIVAATAADGSVHLGVDVRAPPRRA